MALMATSAGGLQAQLGVLEHGCERRKLTDNLVKTKMMLLAWKRSSKAAKGAAERGRMKFGGA